MPLVGVSSCRQQQGDHFYDVAGVKYTEALAEAAQAIPLLIPAAGGRLAIDALLDRLDGLLLTGSPSNVDPALYGALPVQHDGPSDRARDATTLPLIRAAIARDLPVLAICRGNQELNVALGGTLHQQVHDVPGRLNHRADHSKTVDVQYGPAHRVDLAPAGYLAWLSGEGSIEVNSLHEQGIETLAPGLAVEATASDGQIEAVRLPRATFCIGVQWHPEWRVKQNAFSSALFAAFGTACRDYAAAKATDGASAQPSLRTAARIS